MTLPHVVILGGGFAGLAMAQSLKSAAVRVTLLDRRNHHLFQPLLYQVATAALSPGDIAYPIRAALRNQRNVRVLMGEAQSIEASEGDVGGKIVLVDGELSFDYLVLATGVTHSYFGNDHWAEFAPGLKCVDDALEIRRRILFAYEAAERETDPETQRAWLTFVVVGGGPTGVELAGALAEIGRMTVAKDFRAIDPTDVRVVLIEGNDRVLPPYPESLSAKAQHQLEKLGVEIRTSSRVTDIDAMGVAVGDLRIAARTVLWAAGVEASPLAASLGVELDRAGRVIVDPDLRVKGHPRIFVVGDLMAVQSEGTSVPGVAPAAAQAGRHSAKNLRRVLAGQDTLPFRYVDKGSLATVGRSAAVAHIGSWKFSGFFAWVFWWLVHVFFLIGYRNRIIVLFGWAWSYVTFQRGARLITGENGALPELRPGEH